MTRFITLAEKSQELEKRVTEGLDFIIAHLNGAIWPRKISTKATEGRQVLVSNNREALAWYKAANFIDCRISAYPSYPSDANSVCRQTIDLIMIDLDSSTFQSRQSLDRALNNTLNKIKEAFEDDFTPSILWSGNGYHVYIPVEARYFLEQTKAFSKYQEPSKKFLRFAEWYLSDGKCDPAHNSTVSLANCMLRIPGSHNSKCIQRNQGIADSTTQVTIIHDWNKEDTTRRAPIHLLLGNFLAYLVDQQYAAKEEHRTYNKNKNNKYSSNSFSYNNNYNSNFSGNTYYYNRLEKLLQTPIADNRKQACYWLLSRYLINVKDQSPDQAFDVIKNWLLRCNQSERLSPSIGAFDSLVKCNIREAQKSGKLPVGEKLLKKKNEALYNIVTLL